MPDLRALLAAATILCAAPAAAQTTLTVSNWLPPSHPLVRDIVVPWGQAVEDASEGRVSVEVMSSPIGKPPAQYDLVRDGAADVGYGVHGYTPNRFRLTAVAEQPFLSDSAEALSVAYQALYDDVLAAAGEHEGVHVLAVFTHGPGHVFTVSQPVTGVADLEGRKIRIGGGLANEVGARLGVVGVSAPSPQTYEILSNGVADGIFFPYESVPFFKLDTVVRYGTEIQGGLFNTSFFMVMNEDAWTALSKEDRDAIDAVSGVTLARRAGAAWDAADTAGRAALVEAGVTLQTADAPFLEAIGEKVAGVEDAFLAAADEAGIDGQAALARLRGAGGS